MRNDLILSTAQFIDDIDLPHPTRVGIDGVSASGKTVFADDLVKPLEAMGRHVIRTSIDGFHNPPHIRYQRGKDCHHGYFSDSFNYTAVIQDILEPLGPDGELQYNPVRYDLHQDRKVQHKYQSAQKNSILLFEGVMLFRDPLNSYWDYKIFLDVSFDIVLERALKRDHKRLGGENQLLHKYNKRYIPGQKKYLNKYAPERQAHLVVNNNNYHEPYFIRKIMHH